MTRLAPDLPRAYNNLGAAYLELGRTDSAYAMFEHASALYPSYMALSNLASLYYFDGRYADAARAYRRALDLDSHDHLAWGNLAAAYERLAQHDLAVEAYRAAIHRAEGERAVNPLDPVPLAHLAVYYVSVGDSARPTLPKTVFTSGNPARIRSWRCSCRFASSIERLGRVVGM